MHATSATKSVLLVCAIYCVYTLCAKIYTSRRNAAKARNLECREPCVQKNKLPLGIDQLQRALKADKEMQFPVDTIQRFRDVGAFTFRASVMGNETLFTADEKNIQAILATQFNDFDIGPVRRANFFPLLGNGIFTQDGKSWQHSRAMMRPQFAREQVSDLELEEHHIQSLMRVLPATNNGWTDQVDLQKLFFRLTLDSATEFLFGHSVNSQLDEIANTDNNSNSPTSPNEKIFASAFDSGTHTLAKRIRFKDKYWLVHPSDFTAACKACHAFIDHFVAVALSKVGNKAKPEAGKYVFLEALAAETQDPIELRSQSLHILLAGRDTTASLLSWLFFSLARSPAHYAKLRSMVLEQFGTYDAPRNITFASLKSCKYLQYCMNEALRLYPVVPMNFRQANRDTTLPRGGGKDGMSKVFVPAGTQVDYSVHVLHHREDLWGADVEEFRPERWEGRRVGWEFLPFNGGPRICIGQQFALTEASYVTVRLLQKFDKMENLDPCLAARHKLGLTNSSGNGVQVKLHVA